ncbi:caspase family protein [Burkholderia ubonensis]|uniref:caspase family protein n=1 Tax=Burkholderia ubonensis TaxID=101571 RepID=UPI000AB180E5|nr:caspase family protein [Burkholderia ubonensis]
MPLLLDRPVEGPRTHAFVIGVGQYPHAKAGRGVLDILGKVPDLPSAADSAKLMCDWLLDNQDRLAAPLATLDVLISDPANPNHRYPWARGPVDTATKANVAARGRAWYERVVAEPGNVAFFYCCGHGASHLQQPVLFLEDLNQSPDDVWTHINLNLLALALRKSQSISAAFLFSDACGQFVPEFELEKDVQDCRFFHKPNLFAPSRNQVSLLCAAAEGQLAYEGADRAGGDCQFGRFTQAVLKGLSGSSARWSRNRWGVSCRDLLGDLKSLRRVFFSHWSENEPFEPYPAVTQADPIPIVYPDGFELPLVVMTDPPDRMPHYDFVISQKREPTGPWLKNRNAGDPNAWHTTVPPGLDALYAIAVKGADHYPLLFQPKEPLFDQWVPVP